jgi:hypothetical protein
MRTNCIIELLKLKIFKLNTLVQKETSDHVEEKPPPSNNFVVGVYKGGHSEIAYPLVLAIAALILYKLAGGLVKGR